MMGDGSDPASLGQIEDAQRRGELLRAFDLAESALADYPEDVALQHQAVLALARAGATQEAGRRFATYGLDAVPEEDVAALGARIAKDKALAARTAERPAAAHHAARLYADIYERTGGYYPAINAATLELVAGAVERSRTLAHDVLRQLARHDDTSYYAVATAAEAYLLLGDVPAATDALARAARLHGGDFGALATTRRQLRHLCELQRIDPRILEPLSGPSVAHYCGHIVAAGGAPGRFHETAEPEVASRIARELERRPVGVAYGALAAGADILWAEALLAARAEVHVVLPFNRDEFVAASVAPAGGRWVDRFHQCLGQASSLTYGTEDAFRFDDALFRYGADLAMGLAVLRAGYLDADVRQLAVWDGKPTSGEAGTAADVARWLAGERAVSVVHPGSLGRPDPAGADTDLTELRGGSPISAAGEAPNGRVVRALLFADVRGFSRLTDEQLPRFADEVLGAFARVLDRHAGVVEHRNTWGDALYAVVRGVEPAGECALELQEAMSAINLDRVGLPAQLALRLGAHVGPVFPVHDPVLRNAAFMGSHVSRTARVEPVTPTGEVYVTEPFAAALALSTQRELSCDYVGHLPAAKDFGRLRMYRLHRRS